MAKLSLKKINKYMLDRVGELQSLASRGDPWFFVCASSYIEYLAKLEKGASTNNSEYKLFLTKYLFVVLPKYRTFSYSNARTKLEDQIYHVLRCGLVHSFSLIPDARARFNGGQDRSILLAHRKSGIQHLSPFVNNKKKPKIDGCIFIAEDFADDLKILTEFLFKKAAKRNERVLRNNVIRWATQHPPVNAKF